MAANRPEDASASDPLLALAERAPFAVAVVRLAGGEPGDTEVEYVNGPCSIMFSRFLDAPRPGPVRQPLADLLPGTEAAQAAEVAVAVIQGESSRSGVWRLAAPSGEAVVLEYHSVFVPPDRVYSQFSDVTSREILDAEREEATFRLRLAFDASPDGFAILRVNRTSADVPDEFEFEAVNDAARDLIPDLVVDATVPVGHPLFTHITETVPLALGSDGPLRGQREVVYPDRTVVYDFGMARVSDDRVLVSFRDVTDSVRLQAQVAESARLASRARRLMYVALDSSPIAFTVYRVRRGPSGKPVGFTVEFVNEQAVPVGLEVRDIVGRDILDAYPLASESGFYDELLAVADDLRPHRFPVEEPGPDGSPRHFEAILSRVDDDLVVSSFIEVTELRRAQRALADARDVAVAASQAKSDFLATVTHEIRTPLTTMISATEILLDSELDDDQRSLVKQQRDGARMLLALVNDILDLSKIEAGRLELELLELDVGDLVTRTVGMFASAVGTKGLEITTSIDPAVPSRVIGDPVRLQQILLNLISNAVKFTDRGGVAVEVTCSPVVDGHVTVQFQVLDTGIGIPSAVANRLFQPFAQASSSTARIFGGSGLGLSIAQRLVNLMGGSISIAPRGQQGTVATFTAVLTVVDATEDATEQLRESQASEPAADTPAMGPALRVLLAEDNDVNRVLISRMLAKLGCRVAEAANGVEAVAAVERDEFDLVLMDLRMPEMDGLTAARRIREFESGTGRRTEIVALTANATRDVVLQTREAGMDGFLSKPITLPELRSAVAARVPTSDPVP